MKKSAGAILIEKNKVLLVKPGPKSQQLPGTYSFPDGHIEDGENEEETAKRELQEETGLIADKLVEFQGNYVKVTLTLKTGRFEYSFKSYLVQEYHGELHATEETTPEWIMISEARKMKLFGKNNQILEDALRFLGLK